MLGDPGAAAPDQPLEAVEDTTPDTNAPLLRGASDAADPALVEVEDDGDENGDDADDDSSEDGDSSAAKQATGPRFIVRGRFRGPTGADALSTGVFVGGGENAEGDDVDPARKKDAAVTDGTFEVDVTSIQPETRTVIVRLDHRDHMPGVMALSREQFVRRPESSPPIFEAQVELPLAPAWVIEGVVVEDESDKPRYGAELGLFAADATGTGIQPLDAVESDGSGVYRLRAARPGDYLVFAKANDDEPRMQRVVVDPDERHVMLPEFRLVGAQLLRGKITIGGRAPAQRVSLTAHRKAGRTPAVDYAYSEIAFDLETLQCWYTDETDWTNTEGEFELDELSATEYEFEYYRSDGPALWGRREPTFEPVRVPRDYLHLNIPGASLRVDVTSNNQPVENVPVTVEIDGRKVTRATDEHGVQWIVPVDASITIRVPDGEQTQERVIGPFIEGEHHVETLRVGANTATLVVHADGDLDIETLGVWISYDGPGYANIDPQKGKDGVFVFEGLHVGTASVTTSPNRSPFAAWGFVLRKRFSDVAFKAGEETHLRIHPTRGGRLRIEARDRADTRVGVLCTIHAMDGKRLRANYEETDGYDLRNDAPTVVRHPLAVGRYQGQGVLRCQAATGRGFRDQSR